MTIAAGFVCTDGVLLAADTLFTGVNKRYASKTWVLPPLGETVVILSGSGLGVVLERAKLEIARRLSGRVTATAIDVIQEIDGVLYLSSL